MPGLVGVLLCESVCVRVCVSKGSGGWGCTQQNDIPPFVSTFLRRLHSFCVTALLQGKPAVAEEQEEDAGAVCMGERGPGTRLNRATKGTKMVQCHGN